MENLKKSMINKAISRHGEISPCGDRETLHDCFTHEGDTILFWYNCSENSTHLIVENF